MKIKFLHDLINVMAKADSFLTWILVFILVVLSAVANYFICWSYKIFNSRKFGNYNNYD